MSTGPEDDGNSDSKVEAFLLALRRSAEIAHDLSRTTMEQAERIRSLDADLGSARARVAFLEGELSALRSRLGSADLEPGRFAQLDALLEEQNCLAHLFVTSDRLARSRSAAETVQIADEVLHNLIGALRYGLWLRWESGDGGELALVAPVADRYRRGVTADDPLVAQGFGSRIPVRAAGTAAEAVPVAMPLLLEGRTVGVLHIAELVPHASGRMDRLQGDLLGLLCERLPVSLCIGALGPQTLDPRELWLRLRSQLTRLHEVS
jgi:hypothetical protein